MALLRSSTMTAGVCLTVFSVCTTNTFRSTLDCTAVGLQLLISVASMAQWPHIHLSGWDRSQGVSLILFTSWLAAILLKKKKKPQQLLSCAWTETWNLFADGGSPGLDLFTVAVSLRQQGTGWCEHKREDTCPLWIIQSFTCCASYRRSLEKNPVI